MEQFPLTANGKVDRAALTSSPAQANGNNTSPDGEIQVWTSLFSDSKS
ncbi:hypothetical protein [Amycolatopsis plumensis]|uniref:Uncharacterized protein n=1 Tax=Amycolatopsis plumensis TaxID=236508 RepID=A0ABV5UBM0_9PSEU